MLLALTDPDVELVGPRGTAHGHEALADWAGRSGIELTAGGAYARGGTVVLEQTARWRDPETGEPGEPLAVASAFAIRAARVARVARYDALDAALAAEGLTRADAVRG